MEILVGEAIHRAFSPYIGRTRDNASIFVTVQHSGSSFGGKGVSVH
jgi:hypothetical protein